MTIFILPADKHGLVEAGIKTARASKSSAYAACNALINDLKPHARPANIKDLIPGKKYGVIDAAVNVTVGRAPSRTTTMIYEYLYVCGKHYELANVSAWGQPYEIAIRPGMLLTEQP